MVRKNKYTRNEPVGSAMLHQLLLAMQLVFGSATSDGQLAETETAIDVSIGDIICLTEELADRYFDARSAGEEKKLAWYSDGCAKAARSYENQRLVRRTSYGVVVQLSNGRWSHERHVLFAQIDR